MNQELQYLRDELNQRLCMRNEYSNKTINTVLLIWGGVFAILGNNSIKFMAISYENIPFYFLSATLFFISTFVPYLAARKYYNNASMIFKLAAFINVFYEKRLNKDFKVSDEFIWESTNFEIMSDDITNKTTYKNNNEYQATIIISLLLIIGLSVVLFLAGGLTNNILLLICVIYIAISIVLFFAVPKISIKDNYNMRIYYLYKYFNHSIDTGYYTIEEIKNRFGRMYEKFLQEVTSRGWSFPDSTPTAAAGGYNDGKMKKKIRGFTFLWIRKGN